MQTLRGNVTEPGDAGGGPGESFLFFLTAKHPEIGLSGARVRGRQSPAPLSGPVRSRRPLKIRGRNDFPPVVPITAAGLQGEQPLVDGTM